MAGSQLEQPVEHQAAASRAAPVEPEYELVQVALQVRLLDRALVGAQQPSLGQRDDSVHRGQQLPLVRGLEERMNAARTLTMVSRSHRESCAGRARVAQILASVAMAGAAGQWRRLRTGLIGGSAAH
jgi:hypothetical protein